ncbi:hypothetical protein ACFQY7_34870 [Actinomadura luteofluorescens]|uniref:hypothetical protein n=1 Tax=Actinomadura luteofluorescens TaxID=46163 RepID=UPI003627E55E
MAINTVIGLYYYLAWAVRLFTPSATSEDYDAAPGLGVRVAITAAAAARSCCRPRRRSSCGRSRWPPDWGNVWERSPRSNR